MILSLRPERLRESRDQLVLLPQIQESAALGPPGGRSLPLRLERNRLRRPLPAEQRSPGRPRQATRGLGQKIQVPVLFGLNGQFEKSFEADAYHEAAGFVVEVEAGRGVVNNQFLKDLFQACMMNGVTEFAVALRNDYRGTKDFERAARFFDTLYASNRLKLPLEGVLLIGY